MNKLHIGILMLGMAVVYGLILPRCGLGASPGTGTRFGELTRAEREAIAGDRLGPDGSFRASTYRAWVLDLVERGDYEQAAEEIVWLWRYGAVLDAPFVGVRGSYLVQDIRRLAEAHPPVLDLLREVRDELEPGLREPMPNRRREARAWGAREQACRDWIDLNEMLGEPDRTLAWVAALGPGEIESTYSFWVAEKIVRLLVANDRGDLITRTVSDPIRYFEDAMDLHHQVLTETPMPQFDTISESNKGRQAAAWYIALLANDDAPTAEQLVEVVFEPGRGVNPSARARGFASALEQSERPLPPRVQTLLPSDE